MTNPTFLIFIITAMMMVPALIVRFYVNRKNQTTKLVPIRVSRR